MDMASLIDNINKHSSRLSKFCILMLEKGKPACTKELARAEDAIAFLFDADIFGWSIKDFNWCNSSCNNGVPWWELEVTLFKTN